VEVIAVPTPPPSPPIPVPLEAYAARFDDLFSRSSQRAAFRQYLAGLLLPSERGKTLTALANAEPIVGAQRPAVQRLQWFLSESTWDATAITARRLAPLRTEPATALHGGGALIVDEIAHVGRQYLGNRGKIENGVVSVASVWADDGLYYPLAVEPYTPERWFARGKADPAFRTKPAIALALADRALAAGWPFRAVVADCLYGEHHGFREELRRRGVPYVLALRPSHAWWAPQEEINWVQGAAAAAAWVRVERRFGDGHAETWWALEAAAGPYGPDRASRLVVATTLPVAAADLAEVVRLYGLRNWIEQDYKQVKHALGWSQYQVRSDWAIRRHWALVQCAFAYCWWAEARGGVRRAPPAPAADRARGAAAGAGLAGAGAASLALLAGAVGRAAARPAPSAPGLGRPRPPAPPL
jgi:DDE superfamily endonuclease